MFYADDVFGAKHLRSAEFRGLSDTFLVNSFEDTRNTINDDKLVIIDQIKKSDDNSKRILAANKDNLEDIMDIFIGEPYMNKEAQEHLLELYTQLKMDPEAKQPLMEHMLGGDYVADLISSELERRTGGNYTSFTDKNGNTYKVSEDGISQEFVNFMQTPIFKQAIQEQVSMWVDESTPLDETIFITFELSGKTSKNFMEAKFAASKTKKAFNPATWLSANIGDLTKMSTSTGLSAVYDNNMASKAMGKKVIDLLTADPRLARMEIMKSSVGKGHIDLKVPNLNDPYNLMWITRRLNIDNELGTISSKQGDIVQSILRIEKTHLSKNEENSLFDLPANVKEELVQLRKELSIRQAQKRVILELASSEAMVEKFAKFRQNVKKIIGGNVFKAKRSFTQEEVHNYKEHSVLSDFFNDYVTDPETIHAIQKKRKDNKETLTKEESTTITEYETYISHLLDHSAGSIDTKTNEHIKIINDITSYDSLMRAVGYLEKYRTLEQAKEVIDGLLTLVREFPMNSDNAKATKELDARKLSVERLFDAYNKQDQVVDRLLEAYSLADKTPPDVLTELRTFSDKLKTKDIEFSTNDVFIQAEKLMIQFYKALPAMRETVGEQVFYHSIAKNTETAQARFILLSRYDVTEFYKHYKTELASQYEGGRVPNMEQELDALMINAFIHSTDPAKLTDISEEAFFMYVSGIAGSGKTHMVGKLALGVAAQQVEFEDESKVLYASNHDRQIDNLKEGLKGLDLTDKGYNQKELFNLLESYIRGEAEAVSILDSVFTIVFDEATMLNARKTGGDLSMNKLKELIVKINNIRKSNKDKQGKNSKPLKVILTGDNSQVGFTDDNMTGEVSDLGLWMNINSQFKGLELEIPFRYTNEYIEEGTDLIKSIDRNSNSRVIQHTVWGTQPQYNDKRMGVQISLGKHGDFESMMDQETYDNIIKQLAADPDFTAVIVPSVNTVLGGDSLMMKLVNENERVHLIPENKIQGLEYNYVITEWDPTSIGEYSTTLDKSQVKKHMYTLVSRAKDYVKVLNANQTVVKSAEVNGQIIIPTEEENGANKKAIYDYLLQVHKGAEVEEVSNKEGKKEEPPTEEGGPTQEEADKAKLAEERKKSFDKIVTDAKQLAALAVDLQILKLTLQHRDLSTEYRAELEEKLKKAEEQMAELSSELEAAIMAHGFSAEEQATFNSLVKEETEHLLRQFENDFPELIKKMKADKAKADQKKADEEEEARKRAKAEKDKMDNQTVLVDVFFKDFTPSVNGETILETLEDEAIKVLENENMSNLFKNTFRSIVAAEVNLEEEYYEQDIEALFEDSPEMQKMFILHKSTFRNFGIKAKKALVDDFKFSQARLHIFLESLVITTSSNITETDAKAEHLREQFTKDAKAFLTDEGIDVALIEDIFEEELNSAIEALAISIEVKNTKSKKKRVQDNREDSESSNQFSEFTSDELRGEYILLQQKYGTLATVNEFLAKIKRELVDTGNIDSNEDYIEYIRVTDLLDAIIETGDSALMVGYLEHSEVLKGDDLKLVTEEIENLAIENQDTGISFISKSEIYTMKRNQLESLLVQAHPLYDNEYTDKDGLTKEKQIASDVISASNIVSGSEVNMTPSGVQRVMTSTEDIVGVYFVGGMFENEPNGYYLVEMDVAGKSEFILMGKVFLGMPKTKKNNRSLLERVADQREAVNTELGLTGTVNEITELDGEPGNEENMLRKLYPTTYRIRQKIKAATEPTAVELDIEEFIGSISMGAARPTFDDAAPVTIKELREKIDERQTAADWDGGNIQISSHAVINMGETFKGVRKGNAFVLYTTADSGTINLADPDVVRSVLDNKQFYVKSVTGKYIKADIGIIPLRRGPITMLKMYSDMYESGSRNYDLQPFSDKNAALNGTFTNVKVAKSVLSVLDYFTLDGNEELFNMINPVSDVSLTDTEWSAKLIGDTNDAVLAMRDRYEMTDTYVTIDGEGVKGDGSIDGVHIENFIKTINTSAMEGALLSTSDIMSSIFIPMLRNFGTDMYEITGKGGYPANYYSMNSSFVKDGKDKNDMDKQTILSFNTYTMLGAITKEVKVRLEKNGVDSSSIDAAVDEYVKGLILPAMSQLFSHSDVFDGYHKTVAGKSGELINGESITRAVDFHVSTLKERITSVGKTTQRQFVLSRGVNEDLYQLSGITDLAYPAATVQAKFLFDKLFETDTDKGRNPEYDPITGEKYTVEGELSEQDKATQDVILNTEAITDKIRFEHDSLLTTPRTIDELVELSDSITEYNKQLEEMLKSLDNTSIFSGKGIIALKDNLKTSIKFGKNVVLSISEMTRDEEHAQETEVIAFTNSLTEDMDFLKTLNAKSDITKLQDKLDKARAENALLRPKLSKANKSTLDNFFKSYEQDMEAIINEGNPKDTQIAKSIRENLKKIAQEPANVIVSTRLTFLTARAELIQDQTLKEEIMQEIIQTETNRVLNSPQTLDMYMFSHVVSVDTKALLDRQLKKPAVQDLFDSLTNKTYKGEDHADTIVSILEDAQALTNKSDEEIKEIQQEIGNLLFQLISEC